MIAKDLHNIIFLLLLYILQLAIPFLLRHIFHYYWSHCGTFQLLRRRKKGSFLLSIDTQKRGNRRTPECQACLPGLAWDGIKSCQLEVEKSSSALTVAAIIIVSLVGERSCRHRAKRVCMSVCVCVHYSLFLSKPLSQFELRIIANELQQQEC